MKTKEQQNQKTKKQGCRIVLGVSAVIGALAMYACAYDPVWEEEAKPASSPIEKASVDSAFGAAVEELAAPNAYQVRLTWPEDLAADHFTIAREETKSGETVQIMTLARETTEYTDRSVKPGVEYRYHLGRYGSDGFRDHSTGATIPRDFIVNGAQVVNQVGPEFNRLWILANSTILTQGNDLKVEVNQVIAGDNATIDTAPPGTWAAFNTPGRSGGNVSVIAQAATGRLRIFATGQGGGKGTTGASGGTGDVGPRGSPGTTHRVTGSECDRHCPSHVECDRSPGNGGQGGQGRPGARGAAGLPGGDSAKVLVTVANPRDFEVVPSVAPGPGGSGGDGGAGGAGGAGGGPGECPSVCSPARSGPQGPRGPDGGVGPQGASGNKQPVCLKLGTSLVGDCSGFTDMTR